MAISRGFSAVDYGHHIGKSPTKMTCIPTKILLHCVSENVSLFKKMTLTLATDFKNTF